VAPNVMSRAKVGAVLKKSTLQRTKVVTRSEGGRIQVFAGHVTQNQKRGSSMSDQKNMQGGDRIPLQGKQEIRFGKTGKRSP